MSRYQFLHLVILFSLTTMIASGMVGEARTVDFSGYTWKVKHYVQHKRGPGPNYWSASRKNVRVDGEGNLHLNITEQTGHWYCAEVYLDRFLGYGEYIFYLDPQKTELPDKVVMGLFLYGGPGKEVDIEISGWDKGKDRNIQFIVQPAYITGHLYKFNLNLLQEKWTFKINWSKDEVIFSLIRGHNPDPDNQALVIERWIFTGDQVPKDRLYPHMNLWLFEGDPPEKRDLAEIVVEKFEFIRGS
ncbi:MAG: glycoside hydrolase family 16 protein [Candidatus Bipolaricaulia bacterium]